MNYSQIFEKYLCVLEVGKSYKLGAIFARLQAKNEPVDISFLFLFLQTDSRFQNTIVSQDIEQVIIKRIS